MVAIIPTKVCLPDKENVNEEKNVKRKGGTATGVSLSGTGGASMRYKGRDGSLLRLEGSHSPNDLPFKEVQHGSDMVKNTVLRVQTQLSLTTS